jgi:hypothetical protein
MVQDYGVRYALPNKDLKKKDPDDIGFSSSFNTLKTFVSGVVSKTATHGALTSLQVPHGLGYRPAFNAYFRDTLSGEVYPVASGFENTEFNRSGSEINVHAKSDNYNLNFDIWNDNSTTDKGIDIYYEVFYEDLTTEPATIRG